MVNGLHLLAPSFLTGQSTLQSASHSPIRTYIHTSMVAELQCKALACPLGATWSSVSHSGTCRTVWGCLVIKGQTALPPEPQLSLAVRHSQILYLNKSGNTRVCKYSITIISPKFKMLRVIMCITTKL